MKRLFVCEKCGNVVNRNAVKCDVCGQVFNGIKCPRCGFSGEADLFAEGCPACGFTGSFDSTGSGNKPHTNNKSPFVYERPKKEKRMLPLAVYRIVGIVALILIIVLIVIIVRYYV